jgi:hypothetical protein
MASSEKMNELQKDTKEIIRDINDLLKFCWIKRKNTPNNKRIKRISVI